MNMWQVFIWPHLMRIFQNSQKNRPNIWDYPKTDPLNPITIDTKNNIIHFLNYINRQFRTNNTILQFRTPIQ